MPAQNAAKPATAETVNGPRKTDRAGQRINLQHSNLTPRRQHLALHLHAAGPRPVLEALLAAAGGQPLDDVLEDFGRLPVEVYRAVGADRMPPVPLSIVGGGHHD